MLGDNGSTWLERLHMQIARNLRSADWSQTDIAAILGTTQSTVSRRAHKTLPSLSGSADNETIDGWANEISNGLIQIGRDSKPIRQRFVIEMAFGPNQVVRYDKTLTGTDLDTDQEQRAILRRIEWATGRINPRKMEKWVQSMGLNIACCTNSADSAEDVAAYPGRMTIIGGRVRHHETPAFGSSSHLAELLLDVRDDDPEKTAILNIRPPMNETTPNMELLETVAEESGLRLAKAKQGELVPIGGRVDLVIDEGGFGWEPTLYIVGHNPLELVDRAHNIIEKMEMNK